jgi:hypothetical protein
MIYKAQHRKVKIKHHEHSNKTGMNSGASEGWTDPATLVAPVVLYLLQTPWYVVNKEKIGL